MCSNIIGSPTRSGNLTYERDLPRRAWMRVYSHERYIRLVSIKMEPCVGSKNEEKQDERAENSIILSRFTVKTTWLHNLFKSSPDALKMPLSKHRSWFSYTVTLRSSIEDCYIKCYKSYGIYGVSSGSLNFGRHIKRDISSIQVNSGYATWYTPQTSLP
jgi:hypothetical protein